MEGQRDDSPSTSPAIPWLWIGVGAAAVVVLGACAAALACLCGRKRTIPMAQAHRGKAQPHPTPGGRGVATGAEVVTVHTVPHGVSEDPPSGDGPMMARPYTGRTAYAPRPAVSPATKANMSFEYENPVSGSGRRLQLQRLSQRGRPSSSSEA